MENILKYEIYIAQQIHLNLEEIFIWYFEQKGVDNPARFLGTGVNSQQNPLNAIILQALANNLLNKSQNKAEKNIINAEKPEEKGESFELVELLSQIIKPDEDKEKVDEIQEL